MKVHTCSVLLATLALATASAYDLTTRGGRVYKDIRLREKADLGIRFAHEGGVAWLDYSEIPVPDLWTFGFMEDRYAAAVATKKANEGAVPNAPQGLEPTPEAVDPFASSRPTRLYRSTSTAPRPMPLSSAPATSPTQPTPPTPQPRATEPRPFSPSISSSSSTHRSQCAATTKKGYRCSRLAAAGSSYCWQHP